MKVESFQIRFNWETCQRQLQISTPIANRKEPVLAMYHVFRNNIYLFSIRPVIDAECNKIWEIIEKDREAHLPPGFIGVLGSMIDAFYIGD
jgi:hypothetical protein